MCVLGCLISPKCLLDLNSYKWFSICLWMWRFPAMFRHAEPSSSAFLEGCFSGWCVFDRCWQIATEEPPEFCVVRATYIKVQKLGLYLQSLIFLTPRRVSPFSRGVVFTLARVSLAHLSLRKNGTTCSPTFVISRFPLLHHGHSFACREHV